MIQSLLTQLSKQTEFIQKQNYELQSEVPLNWNSMLSKNNNQSDNNSTYLIKINPFNKWQLLIKLFNNLNPSLQNLKEITLSIQVGGKNNSEKLSSDSSASAEKKSIVILDAWLSMLMDMKFQRNLKIVKFSLEAFQGLKLSVRRITWRPMKPSITEKPEHKILHIGTN